MYALWNSSKSEEQKFDYRKQQQGGIKYSQYNYPGEKLDQLLSLREQIDITYKKASGRLYLLRWIRPQLTVEVALTIYKTMLIPLFTYCSIISSTYTETLNQRINSFERRAHEVIFKRKSNFPNNASIRSIQRKRLSTQVFNCVHGNVCDNYNNYFTIMSNKTRNCNNLLRLPKIRLETTKKSFYLNGAKVFNELPKEVRCASTITEFVKLYNKVFDT